ncbi:MAG: 3-methyladenine DNA glycosylase 2 [Proteobacteria bacterium]|nr:3-methyladenine DNA glycosylase 2 [Pseudomonadota bacterium]MDA1332435.1 3-methyladenine DNA glycosylase 2 [Pseudomonadota bacterium]
MTTLRFTIPLPDNFRSEGVLRYYGRDLAGVSERASDTGFEKGFWIDGVPAWFTINFHETKASIEADVDARLNKTGLKDTIDSIVSRVLGLLQPVAEFESMAFSDAILKRMVIETRGLRVPQAVSPWEALISSVIGQQVSVAAASSTRSRLIKGLGAAHSSGLYCFPQPKSIASCSVQEMRIFGLSSAKANTIHSLAVSIESGELSLGDSSGCFDFEPISSALLSFKGVGPWTINNTFLRGYSFLDGSLHGDMVVRKKIQQLLGKATLSIAEAEQWMIQYKPWRGLLAAHLWAMK